MSPGALVHHDRAIFASCTWFSIHRLLAMTCGRLELSCEFLACKPKVGDRKSLPIAKNHPKPSQEFREQIGPSLRKMKGFSKSSHQKVHPNFAKNLGRQILGNAFSGPKKGLGEGSTREKIQKWLGEGAKGLSGQEIEKPLALVQIGIAPVQKNSGWCKRLLGDLGSLGPKDLLHATLT